MLKQGLILALAGAAAVAIWRSSSVSAGDRAAGSPADEVLHVEVATVGVDMLTRSPVVLLRHFESGQVVPIWIGLNEAQAIARALHGVELPRPMTHDLMGSLLTELGATVEEIVVHDLREQTYHARLRIRRAGEEAVRDVDSRPSDAIALALRVGAPIRVARKVFDASPELDFAAPDDAEQVVRALGITVVAPTPALRREFALGQRDGVVVTQAAESARELGLRRGDLIVEVNGRTPGRPMEFLEAVLRTPVGEAVRIDYWRAGETRSIEIPLTEPQPMPRPRRGPGQMTV